MKLYTAKVVSRFLDISERRVGQLRDEGVLLESANGLYDLQDATRRYINYLRQRNPEGDENIDFNTERAKYTRAKRKNEEYDLLVKEKRLHYTEDIEIVIAAILINFKTRLLAIPSKLAPILCKKSDKAEVFQIVKEYMDEVLNELSDLDTIFTVKAGGNEGGKTDA